ncbi:sialic acid-binding Ig-like lectin 15 [Egretta garzetta]|uniref:sialic acid-binding Ig-like lectin 15 n=1 Tax=Egretta garzetta TaxID=188379 RepID=UPI00163BC446|nr:sialic acid-binding Ig-like lectin 15 [Egretta garzetta]
MREFGLFLLCLLHISRKGVQSNGWSVHVPSDVTGELGKMVVLPCTFTHPYKTFDRTLTAIWRIKEPYNGTIVFKCISQSTSELCKTAISLKNKYKLLGNPRHKDLSIRIDNLTWSDSERYFCRVELSGDIHDKYFFLFDCFHNAFRSQMYEMGQQVQQKTNGSPPHVVISAAAPRIINITVTSNGDRTFQARCTAEGEPAPTLTWTGPPHSNLTSTTSMNHRVTKELQYLAHDGKYTCTAVNSHGRAEGAVYFYKFKASNSAFFLILIFVPLGIKVLILLVILGFTVFSRGGPSSAPSSLARPQLQDSTYENFDRRQGCSQALPTERTASRRS